MLVLDEQMDFGDIAWNMHDVTADKRSGHARRWSVQNMIDKIFTNEKLMPYFALKSPSATLLLHADGANYTTSRGRFSIMGRFLNWTPTIRNNPKSLFLVYIGDHHEKLEYVRDAFDRITPHLQTLAKKAIPRVVCIGKDKCGLCNFSLTPTQDETSNKSYHTNIDFFCGVSCDQAYVDKLKKIHASDGEDAQGCHICQQNCALKRYSWMLDKQSFASQRTSTTFQ